MKWYEMSVIQKLELIYDAWKELNIYNVMFIPHIQDEEQIDIPVSKDGFIKVELETPYGNMSLVESEDISYRAIHPNNKKYMKHILKTLSLRLAKRYFNIPKEI